MTKAKRAARAGGGALAPSAQLDVSDAQPSETLGANGAPNAVATQTAVVDPESAEAPFDPRQQIEHIRNTAVSAANQYPYSCSRSTYAALQRLGYNVVTPAMDANAQIMALDKLCQ